MVASLDEPFLASNGNVRSASIIGASRLDKSRIISPGMNKDISSLSALPTLEKIVCHSEDGYTNMDPIVTGFGIIGQGR